MAEDQEQPKKTGPKSSHAEREEKILAFWNEKGIFKKSVDKDAPRGDFTFYDGPPFATGLPHYGHILPGTVKDVIPRYKTMQGWRVRRRWGWDCHGLPVENLIEKELGLKSKKDILDYGIGKFNDKARESVMRYEREWRDIIPRLGRWVDMDDDYKTMDATYTESVWHIFKQLHDKKLLYEGFKIMYLCPRCGTTLSNFEVAQGYKDITDISAYVKFELQAAGSKEEQGKTFLLAWTTTPWTLPGNAALAVGAHVEYSKVKMEGSSDIFIVATERLVAVSKGKKFEVVGTLKGSQLVGKSYKPLFDYYSNDKTLKNAGNGWKIYSGDFVTTTDGTGIVHIAPAFGADDYDLGLKHDLPFIQHVAADGTFKPEIKDFAGNKVKPIDTAEDKNLHQTADIEVIKWLAHHGSLFEKEKLIHSYPHCWRCETPLLNYASSSWFVEVTALKGKLVRNNQKVKWVPPSVGHARFGNWLEGARDWAISRSRFWGAPIPVWREERSGAIHVLGSVNDLKKYSKAKNTYYVMRHGEAQHNITDTWSTDPKEPNHLTEKGKQQVQSAAASFQGMKPDIIVMSPFVRTRETAEIVHKAPGFEKAEIKEDDRLREMGVGAYDGMKGEDFAKIFPLQARFRKAPEGVENYVDIRKRVANLLYELEKKHQDKTIFLVTHGAPAMLLEAVVQGFDHKRFLSYEGTSYIRNAEIRKLDFAPLPHNADYKLDLHRPFIDDIELRTPTGEKLVRVPDVFDCWFESGSMPYGESHYPFEGGTGVEEGQVFDPKSGLFRKSSGFPADVIAEGVDQTRGWFYSMLVIGTALFNRSPYKNVVVNGLILAEDGQKMSKSKNNYPDPMLIVDKYGADALRYYLMSSQAVRGEELCFSEKGVDEVVKKVVNRLLNVVSFYEMYENKAEAKEQKALGDSNNILDRWIIARLNQAIAEVTVGLEAYELDRAARPIEGLIDDLSTWYLRRSRERFKGDDAADKDAALSTIRFILVELSKIMAPFTPFLAEDVYMRATGGKESVHLEEWPVAGNVDQRLLRDMEAVRMIASKGLEARMAAKLNVRQPLQSLKVKGNPLSAELSDLIKDEVNVKKIEFNVGLVKDVELDLQMTPELKEEGDLRELLRKIQDLRKEKGLSVGDKASLIVPAEFKALTDKFGDEIQKATGINSIESGDALKLKD